MKPQILSRHVSFDTLASVPWVGVSRLVTIMENVIKRGPNTKNTWISLISRANIIMKSFSTRHLSRMIMILSKCQFCDQSFIERLKSESMKRVDDSDILSCSGFLFGLDKMGVCDAVLLNHFRNRVIDQIPASTVAYPLVLLLNIFAKHKDREMTNILLSEILKKKDTLTPQGFAMPLIDVLSNFSKDDEIAVALTPLFLESLNNSENMDLRSLVQVYNALGKSEFPSKSHYLDFLANHIVKHIEWVLFAALIPKFVGKYTPNIPNFKLLRKSIAYKSRAAG
ncbi:hypothetical protein BEWA_023920 [Theileria equi strain WA]|uniref:Uncharacterized protein n=1 Tax=Theileria equi strain WA TaxID=1537102 RepID=L0AWC2_THEEQ|nr:hypothetical protein BEWA_023920 [Theileria equi strain WA]AFZ79543.1 hypothetical protein BEWA_023920 [Theileria equi strain WA]|eukprot:XP_004829209.1 hypothetical protein BEWA_023920 [Theileria equi strain WA]